MKNHFLILKILITLLLHHQLYATTYIVGKQKLFSSIKQALQQCKNGDTILVEKGGLYKEQNIIIDKSIVLKGLQRPVLDVEHKYEIISVKADNVVVDGFHLQHSGRSNVDDIA